MTSGEITTPKRNWLIDRTRKASATSNSAGTPVYAYRKYASVATRTPTSAPAVSIGTRADGQSAMKRKDGDHTISAVQIEQTAASPIAAAVDGPIGAAAASGRRRAGAGRDGA